jgi:hypothetical protein
MTSESESRIPYNDLRFVAVRCKGCGMELTVDIEEERQQRVWTEGRAVKCCVCDADFGGAIKQAIAYLRLAVAAAKASGNDVVIRLPTRGSSPPDQAGKGT